MPYTLHLHDHLAHIKWHGSLTADDPQRILEEFPRLTYQLGYAPDFLHTFDEVTALQFSLPELPSSSRFPLLLRPERQVRCAAVARGPLHLTIARLFHTQFREPSLDTRIFPSKEAALHWLLIEKIEAAMSQSLTA